MSYDYSKDKKFIFINIFVFYIIFFCISIIKDDGTGLELLRHEFYKSRDIMKENQQNEYFITINQFIGHRHNPKNGEYWEYINGIYRAPL